MAFTSNSNLHSHSKLILRDQQHADHMFNSDQFRLAPKHNFLFHVAFSINPNALQNLNLVGAQGQEINMLVKSVDLPSYKVETVMLNQYNRKKVMQTKHTPGEVGIKFHDDNMGLINQLWQNYYNYYYADPLSAEIFGAYTRNATQSASHITQPYGLDNGSTEPFFNYITVYQMARHEYVSYKFINPIIANWNHNKLSYSDYGLHDNDMKIMYEAVAYGSGEVSEDDPEGFGDTHYDKTPSPLLGNLPGGTSISSGLSSAIAGGIIGSALASINTYQNTSGPGLSTVAGGLLGGAIAGAVGSLVGGIASGLSNISFPGSGSGASPAGTTATSSGITQDSTSEVENTTSGTPGVQTFDDGSSIQTFDDGSTLVTDSEGNVTSTDAPDNVPNNDLSGNNTSNVQTFDDGSSIQTFDDGSTLVTDSEGNLSSTDAPNYDASGGGAEDFSLGP